MKKIALLLVLSFMLSMLFACNNTSDGESKQESDNTSSINSETSDETSGDESMPEENFIDTYVDQIEPHDVTIKKTGDANYDITTELYGGVYKRTFYKRSWGTWNIGGMTFTPDGGSPIVFVPASTDWEYVFRAGKTEDSINFSGGNHGSEKMIDITFYDGETGEELDLDNMEPVTVGILKIVENTQICYHDSPDEAYANVRRTYYYAGNRIYNECEYEIVNDTYFSLSYPTMFPINKDYGTRIIYNLEDGTTREWTTSKVGKADYSGTMDTGNAAMSVDIYGHKDPRYQFHVEIYNKEDMTDNFKNDEKTFYWDMNVNQNKLYFSRFPHPNQEPELVEKGTTWHTLATWDFNFVEDAVYEE